MLGKYRGKTQVYPSADSPTGHVGSLQHSSSRHNSILLVSEYHVLTGTETLRLSTPAALTIPWMYHFLTVWSVLINYWYWSFDFLCWCHAELTILASTVSFRIRETCFKVPHILGKLLRQVSSVTQAWAWILFQSLPLGLSWWVHVLSAYFLMCKRGPGVGNHLPQDWC